MSTMRRQSLSLVAAFILSIAGMAGQAFRRTVRENASREGG